MIKKIKIALICAVSFFLMGEAVHAGVFDLPAFVEQGKFAAGLEPEIVLSNGAGVGINAKAKYGSNNFLNWQAMIGTGSGDREFRTAVTADFEFFPDVEGQPGIALPATFQYTYYKKDALFTTKVTPLIYNTFKTEQADYTGFGGIPIGWNIRESRITSFIQVVLGCIFKLPVTPKFKYTVELGVDIRSSEQLSFTYISGGATYFF